MNKKKFTMIELMTVITLCAILLSISFRVLQPDRAATAIKQVGASIVVWNARAMSESTSYRLEFTKRLVEVYNINDELIDSKTIMSDLSFFDTLGNPIINQTVEFNRYGSMEDLKGAKIYADTYVANVNGFTGHLSYYE